jgi:hypothetical protein
MRRIIADTCSCRLDITACQVVIRAFNRVFYFFRANSRRIIAFMRIIMHMILRFVANENNRFGMRTRSIRSKLKRMSTAFCAKVQK